MALKLQPIHSTTTIHNALLKPSSTVSTQLRSSRSKNNHAPKLFVVMPNRSSSSSVFVVTPNRSSSSSLFVVRASSSGGGSLARRWEDWRRGYAPCLSDVLWPSLGGFAAMAMLGRLDQMMAPRGLSFTIAPLGAVCAVLFATPTSPGAQKYNMFVAQIGCAAFGVLALSIFGPGWLARATALSVSIAFMIITGATHPPAASLPILFIDGAKFHKLHLWYALFPGFTGCLLLCLIQEMVIYLKNNYKF